MYSVCKYLSKEKLLPKTNSFLCPRNQFLVNIVEVSKESEICIMAVAQDAVIDLWALLKVE